MKINWGTGLVIAMALFMGFIIIMVIMMSTNEGFSHDLVTEEYYKKELAYQDEIDAEENLSDFSEEITGIRTENGWQLTFPKEIDPTLVKGTVFLYRPSNKQLDFDIPIELSGTNLLIPDKSLLDGRWNITMYWKYNQKDYLYKASINY